MKPNRTTAVTPREVLTSRLAQAGGGEGLTQPSMRGLVCVLDALASDVGYTTAPQLAERTCYTERWVRHCLTVLEELDLIEWRRGGLVGGKSTPSRIRISTAVLAAS